MSGWLWEELHEFFETNDGSLPEIWINYSHPDATTGGFALLRTRAQSALPEGPLAVANAAGLVTSGSPTGFHVVLMGIASLGVTLPDLGVFVTTEGLALDYRPGADWGPATLEAFFELLADLAALDLNATMSLE